MKRRGSRQAFVILLTVIGFFKGFPTWVIRLVRNAIWSKNPFRNFTAIWLGCRSKLNAGVSVLGMLP